MVAVVVAGLLLGHKAPILQTAQSRIAERMNWRTIAFVLENTVFLLIGLQARWILGDVARQRPVARRGSSRSARATLVAVIVLRLVWVFSARYLAGPARARTPTSAAGRLAAYTFLLGWAGMRGVVTLAAAFVIPRGHRHREVLLLIAFTVVAGTLFLQGLTLPWLARRLQRARPDPLEDALARATRPAAGLQGRLRAARASSRSRTPTTSSGLIKQRIEQRNFAAWERLGTVADQETPSELYSRVRLEMIDAERRRVLEIRSSGQVASEVVSEVLSMLDVEESMLDISRARTATRSAPRAARAPHRRRPASTWRRRPAVETVGRAGVRATASREGTALGRPAPVPRLRATSAAATPRPRRHATAHFHATPAPGHASPRSPARTGAGASSTTPTA